MAKTVVVTLCSRLLTAALAAVCAPRPHADRGAGRHGARPAGVLRPIGLQVARGALVVLGVRWRGAPVDRRRGAASGLARCFVLPPALALSGGAVADAGVRRRCRRCGWGRTPSLAGPTTWPVGLAVVAGWAVVAWLLGAVLLERRDV